MTRYSVQPRDRIFLKCYRFLSFAKNMAKNIGKNISKILSGKCKKQELNIVKNFLIMLRNLHLMQMHLS